MAHQFQHEYFIDEIELAVGIDVLTYTPLIPASFNGHPDLWYPEEGGELEYEVYDLDTGQPVKPEIYDMVDSDVVYDMHTEYLRDLNDSYY